MNHLKPALISYVLPAVMVALVAFLNVAYGAPQGTNLLCSHQYALCTSALCVPQPGDPTKAICFCDVEEGKSMSTVPCNTIAPSTDKNGIRTIYSTYSMEQLKTGKKGMKCPASTPWTWCLNKRCTVDPTNPKKAICVCDVMRTPNEWVTLGGNCDTSTCKNGYWSAAEVKDMHGASTFLIKALGLKQSPMKWCQQ